MKKKTYKKLILTGKWGVMKNYSQTLINKGEKINFFLHFYHIFSKKNDKKLMYGSYEKLFIKSHI